MRETLPGKFAAFALVVAMGAFVSPRAFSAAASAGPRTEMIINYGGDGWKRHQVQEPCILANPKDRAKLIMFFAAAMKPGGGAGSIGTAWANVSEPFSWHESANNPVMKSEPGNAFAEEAYIRLDAVIYHEAFDEYWIYYTGNGTPGQRDAIGLATCPAGADGFSEVIPAKIKRHPGNPILSPKGQGRDDETCVSQGAVLRENGLWYSLYSYRTETQTLPGIRLAVSSDGKEWSKIPGPDLLSAAPESHYIEWHQLLKIGDRYVLLFEAYNGGTRWRANVATSARLAAGWKKAPATLIDQTVWPRYSDDTMFHVATPALYEIDGKWLLYFQAARAGFYIRQNWALWGIESDDAVERIRRFAALADRGP